MINPIRVLQEAFSKLSGKRHSKKFLNELESNIHFLQDPFGDPLHSQRSKQALQFLLDNAEESHPVLLGLIKSRRASNPIAVIEALPRFGRPESIPVLEDIVSQGQETLSSAAALALAQHPAASAREALLRSLSLPKSESLVAAADGLMSRGDQSVCGELVRHINHEDPGVRYHIIQAAWHLGCLRSEELTDIFGKDPDEDIRGLIARFLNTSGDQSS